MSDSTLILSLISLGFFGSFSHCIGMCGPFVITQIDNRLQKTSLENFSNFTKLKNLSLLSYHLGRISTYAVIGFFCSFFTKNIEDFFNFKILSAFFLFCASVIFLNLFFVKKSSAKSGFFKKIRLPFKSKILENVWRFFNKKISILFQDPVGLKGYLLGVILGFIPCGLLYSAFLICGAITNPILAATGMILFGISTFPALFLTALGGSVFTKISQFKFIAKILILVNCATLIIMAVNLL
ncbi:MAG: sulfite exporter TauE/SafE family protein [Rickettsiales bacterium]|nr:sulfite exporter TauE/SafE family protein [Rickettsiales bacterium]